MTKRELIDALYRLDDDAVVICKDEDGVWDNIERVEIDESSIAIVFGGGSSCSDE